MLCMQESDKHGHSMMAMAIIVPSIHLHVPLEEVDIPVPVLFPVERKVVNHGEPVESEGPCVSGMGVHA